MEGGGAGMVGWEATVVACQANKPQNSLAKLCINGSMAPGRCVESGRERAGAEQADRLQLYVQIMQLNCCWSNRERERQQQQRQRQQQLILQSSRPTMQTSTITTTTGAKGHHSFPERI